MEIKPVLDISLGPQSHSQSPLTEHHNDTNISNLNSRLDRLQIESIEQPPNPATHLTNNWEELVTPRAFHHLPDEILINIFTVVIYEPDPKVKTDLVFFRFMRSNYRRLFTLISVCSRWRSVCLSMRSFWSLIPLCRLRKNVQKPEDLYLQRAGSADLHFVVDSSYHYTRLHELVAQHGSRIRTFDLSEHKDYPAPKTLTLLLLCSVPGSLLNLSVKAYQGTYIRRQVRPLQPLYLPNTPEHTLFGIVADSLRTLRLYRFSLSWNKIRLSALVELSLAEQVFNKALAASFLCAVASAPKLRCMQLIWVEFNNTEPDEPDQLTSLPVSLPALELLFLQDVEIRLLSFILRSIIPDSYRIVVGISRADTLRFGALKLQSFNIDTLVIFGHHLRLEDFGLRGLLQTMPTIKSLCIRNYTFFKTTFRGLLPPFQFHSGGDVMGFPTIHRLHIFDSDFYSHAVEMLKEVVQSHDIQELRLGRILGSERREEYLQNKMVVRFENPKDDHVTQPIKDWLKVNVPNFAVVRWIKDVPNSEFLMHGW